LAAAQEPLWLAPVDEDLPGVGDVRDLPDGRRSSVAVRTADARGLAIVQRAPTVDLGDDGLTAIRSVGVNIRPPAGELPEDVAGPVFAKQGQSWQHAGATRGWVPSDFPWDAPALCHQPLYFEEVNVERSGYGRGVLQPVLSGAHFFGTVPLLPYLLTAERPWACVCTLERERPGSYAPYRVHYPPLSVRALAVEAGVAAGMVFALP
jgi:hypothetical protein